MSRSMDTIHSFGRQHDHQHCIDEALATAARICHENGAKLTWIRRRVLELIWSAHEPVLAYDLLKSIRVDKPNAAPPTVYRALEFLSNQKLIHKIQSLNAYTGCPHPAEPHSGLFLICTHCKEIAELEAPEISAAVLNQTEKTGFQIEHQTMEILGVCSQCR